MKQLISVLQSALRFGGTTGFLIVCESEPDDYPVIMVNISKGGVHKCNIWKIV